MITIISGTNRLDSMSLKVADIYYQFLLALGVQVQLLSLQGANVWERGSEMLDIENQFLIPADKFIFVLPEYNGSIPGILKLMMDNSDIKKCWWYKKAMLVGVADGRAGNLRGLDHMTNILNYLKVNVFYNKIPISRINDEIDNEGHLLKATTEKVIRQQIEEYLQF